MRVTTPKEVRMRGDNQEQQGAMWSYVPMERKSSPFPVIGVGSARGGVTTIR